MKFVLIAVLLASSLTCAQEMKLSSSPQAVPAAIPSSQTPQDALRIAAQLYYDGRLDEAIQRYEQMIAENSQSPNAYAGLARAYLKKKNVQLASETTSKAIQVADAPVVRVTLGEIYFRQGKIHEAEHEWVQVINSGHQEARAYLGLARVADLLSLYKTSKERIDIARKLDSTDPDIEMFWSDSLSRPEHIKYLEQYLVNVKNDDTRTRNRLQHHLEYLKAREREPHLECKLAGNVASTESRLVPLLLNPQVMRGLGITVALNGVKANLMLDTGAGGIVVDRGIAEKSHLEHISDTSVWGVGDRGDNAAWIGVAKSIKIGGLEFQDCPITVMNKRSVAEEEGLVGADVFEHFLIDLNFPQRKLYLSALPKRPGEKEANPKLEVEKTEQGEDKDEPSNREHSDGPFDAYVAPEMKSYTKVLRIGAHLLVPTKVGDAPSKFFLIDSGALTNTIDPAAAREVTKVHSDPTATIKGISGSVEKVYSADQTTLMFGHLRQQNQDMFSFDMSKISDAAGLEISGTLGFATLNALDVKIDYRDGLVNFDYNPIH